MGTSTQLIRQLRQTYGVSQEVAAEMARLAAEEAAAKRAYKEKMERRQQMSYYDWLKTENTNPALRWDYKWQQYLMPYLQALIDGDITQLIVNMPPRLGKSELITKRLPVYWLERNPQDDVIVAAYNADLAQNFTMDSMDIYKARNPGEVRSESREEWTTIYGGSVRPVGVGSGVTGRGCECFPAGTLVQTEVGALDILALVQLQCKPKVYAFDHETGQIVLRRIVATREKVSRDLYRITTASGKSIRATGGHYFYSLQRGYTAAKHLRPGEKVYLAEELPYVRRAEAAGEQAVQPVPHLAEGSGLDGGAGMQQLPGYVHQEALRLREGADHLEGQGDRAHQPDDTPCGRSTLAQQSSQPGDLVQDLPCSPPQVQADTVSLVEYVGGTDERVYDLQVEGCHNFFAEGVLVHNCLIVDDPVKNIKEALSRAYQEMVWNWWKFDLRTRRNRLTRTPTVLVMTRWSNDDLTGKLETEPGYDGWVHITLPALAETQEERDARAKRKGREPGEPDPLGREPGESIEEDRLPRSELIIMAQDPFSFGPLYQQEPVQDKLASFKIEHLKFIERDDVPLEAHRIRYWDSAASEGKGDWTVGMLLAKTEEGQIIIEDVVRGQWSEDKVEEVMRETARLDHAMYGENPRWMMRQVYEQEPAGSGKKVAIHLGRNVFAGVDAHPERPVTNKHARIRPFAAAVNRGEISVVRAPWNGPLLNEMRVYVIGVDAGNDDQLDAGAGAYMKLTIEFTMVTIS